VFFIKKKDGSLCLVQDYCALNAVTVKNRYPLPLISKLISQLHRAQYFTKLDVYWGFNNIRIKPGDEWKAAFCTNCGLFKPLIMFFRMTNSPAVTPYKSLGKLSDILYLNNRNNQLERQARSPRNVPLDA